MNKYNHCNSCIVDRSKCIRCRENPIYDDIPTQSLYQSYISTCPNYSEWYKELYGDISPDEEYYCYDYEDR